MPIVQFARAIQAASTQRCSRRASARRGSRTCGSTLHASLLLSTVPPLSGLLAGGALRLGHAWSAWKWRCLRRRFLLIGFRLFFLAIASLLTVCQTRSPLRFGRQSVCRPQFCSFTPGRLGRVADEGHCALVWAACRRSFRSRAHVLAGLNAIHSRPMLQCNMIIVQCNHTRGMT
jgi:hypothetical protein